MRRAVNLIALLGIPTLISLSWLIGGNLIHKIGPMTLSSSRLVIGALVLFFFSNIRSSQKDWTSDERKTWWKNQLILSLTGRVIYLYLSSRALLGITPFEALLISTTLPLVIIFFERVFYKISKRWDVLACAVLSVLATALAIKSFSSTNSFHFSISHIEMIVAMAFFAIHLIFYRKTIKDASSFNPLFAQFGIGALLLLPFSFGGLKDFLQFTNSEWIQFFFYAIVCNLIPFILVHYCLRKFDPFLVGAVSILSPLMSFVFKGIYNYAEIPPMFYVLSLAASLFVLLTIYLEWNIKILKGKL